MKAKLIGLIVGAFAVGFLAGLGINVALSAVAAGRLTFSYDRIEALLAAAALSYFFSSILLAFAGFMGWERLKATIEHRVDTGLKDASHKLESSLGELRDLQTGRFYWLTGLMYGRMCRDEDERGELVVPRQDFLRMAIEQTTKAVEKLRDRPEGWVVKNNLAFYYALAEDRAYGQQATALVTELRGDKTLADNPVVLNTYARVVYAYASEFPDPVGELRRAHDVLQRMLERVDIPDSEKNNARRHLKAINRARASLVRRQKKPLRGSGGRH